MNHLEWPTRPSISGTSRSTIRTTSDSNRLRCWSAFYRSLASLLMPYHRFKPVQPLLRGPSHDRQLAKRELDVSSFFTFCV